MEPLYMADPEPEKRTNWLALRILGHRGDRHRNMMWPGARGVTILRMMARVRFLIASIFIASFLAFYGVTLFHYAPFGYQFIGIAIMLIDLGLLLYSCYRLPLIIARIADITSVERMKREELVREIVRKQRTMHSIKILKALASLNVNAMRSGSLPRHAKDAKRTRADEQFVETLQEMFNNFARHKEGVLDKKEFSAMMQLMSPEMSEADIDNLFLEVDFDRSGEVEFEELVDVMLALRAEKTSAKDLAERLWTLFDADGIGFVDIAEVTVVLQKMGAKWDASNIQQFFIEVDKDGSGKIEKEEFLEFVEKNVE
mmetsp:Transcript_1451/g.3280  ORF Transcript_1451/g.3280 Transcript_1451/m.3280 type:complete len:314 (+) Transcript_1451:1045-1986(+)